MYESKLKNYIRSKTLSDHTNDKIFEIVYLIYLGIYKKSQMWDRHP